jgi:preprotein translocase subunit SecB
MTDTPDPTSGNGAVGGGAEAAQRPQAQIVAQYVRDLSFENIAAQKGNLSAPQPQIAVNVTTDGRELSPDRFEIVLKIHATAKSGEDTVFIAELDYAAIVEVKNANTQLRQIILLVEMPRMIFPFARRILADVTRDGGFPPLLLEPVDFAALYQREAQRRAAATAEQPEASARSGGSGPTPATRLAQFCDERVMRLPLRLRQ